MVMDNYGEFEAPAQILCVIYVIALIYTTFFVSKDNFNIIKIIYNVYCFIFGTLMIYAAFEVANQKVDFFQDLRDIKIGFYITVTMGTITGIANVIMCNCVLDWSYDKITGIIDAFFTKIKIGIIGIIVSAIIVFILGLFISTPFFAVFLFICLFGAGGSTLYVIFVVD